MTQHNMPVLRQQMPMCPSCYKKKFGESPRRYILEEGECITCGKHSRRCVYLPGKPRDTLLDRVLDFIWIVWYGFLMLLPGQRGREHYSELTLGAGLCIMHLSDAYEERDWEKVRRAHNNLLTKYLKHGYPYSRKTDLAEMAEVQGQEIMKKKR